MQISVVQRMKANHNIILKDLKRQDVVANISCSKNESKSQHPFYYTLRLVSCCKYQLFKEWKQITTCYIKSVERHMLLQISVVQRMKANHNITIYSTTIALVVANISCSKNESKSQLKFKIGLLMACCCKYQLFKEWKQITTGWQGYRRCVWLLQISVVQRMKANHNIGYVNAIVTKVVANISCSKNESKSQHIWSQPRKPTELLQISVVQRMKANHNNLIGLIYKHHVVANISCSKNESKSQHINSNIFEVHSCCKYQLFKEWKQITTPYTVLLPFGTLLQISVVQRMKANHNSILIISFLCPVVANISCSKNESKSQPQECYVILR